MAPRGPLRRPHRLLHAHRSLPCLPRHCHHHAQAADLPRHHRGPPPDGGRLPGGGQRAHLPGAGPAHPARAGRLPHAARRHRPQPGERAYRQALPGSGLQGRERLARPGADDVRQGAAGDRRGGPRHRPAGLLAHGAASRAAGQGPAAGPRPHRRARPLQQGLELRQQAGRRRHREAPRGRRGASLGAEPRAAARVAAPPRRDPCAAPDRGRLLVHLHAQDQARPGPPSRRVGGPPARLPRSPAHRRGGRFHRPTRLRRLRLDAAQQHRPRA